MNLRMVWNPSPRWLSTAGLLLLLALLAGAVAGEHTSGPEIRAVQVTLPVGVDSGLARPSDDGHALLLAGSMPDEAVALLHFTLPPLTPDGSRRMLWFERNPVDSLQLTRGDWRSEEQGFFHPDADEGPLPSGFSFALPADWQGDVELELHARSGLRTKLHPQLMSGVAVSHAERQGLAIGVMIYASLFTLALLSLTLFSAARDRLFLVLFGCALVALLTLAAANGHLYQVFGLRLLAGWGGAGLLALGLLLCACLLQLLLGYADTRNRNVGLGRAVNIFCLGMVVVAALCLLGLPMLLPWLQTLALACWAGTASAGLLLLVDAARRRTPMAWPLIGLAALIAVAEVLRELVMLGYPLDSLWTRYGYQLGVAAFLAVLAVGVIGRIGEYRNQRDRDLLARVDSEQRMHREAARSDLGAALQNELRACSEGDIEWTALHLLLNHLLPLMRVHNAVAIARGYHGRDVQVVLPVSRKVEAEASIARRELLLKRHAANGIALQQPVIVSGMPGQVAMEALVPLPIRAPAWGLLLLERPGGEGFTTEELALASEFARLALTHVDQALSSIQLRRSAELDALTGTFNRRTIDQWVARSFREAERDGAPISVLFVDMDHFKAINDKYGHACGDVCLRKAAEALRASLGEGDLLGRYGGEEFIAVLPGRGGAAAREVGEQLRGAVERLHNDWEGQAVPLTVSVGVATRIAGETMPSDTIDRADKALYAAKRGGRNCVQVAPAIFS